MDIACVPLRPVCAGVGRWSMTAMHYSYGGARIEVYAIWSTYDQPFAPSEPDLGPSHSTACGGLNIKGGDPFSSMPARHACLLVPVRPGQDCMHSHQGTLDEERSLVPALFARASNSYNSLSMTNDTAPITNPISPTQPYRPHPRETGHQTGIAIWPDHVSPSSFTYIQTHTR
jgi:hypothetical protein